jgi:hypothetical protein
VRGQRGHVLGRVAAGQQTAVHLGVQGFDTAVQHFGETGDLGHLGHGQTGIGQQLGGAAGGDEAHAQGVQLARQIQNASFVRYREKGSHGVRRV